MCIVNVKLSQGGLKVVWSDMLLLLVKYRNSDIFLNIQPTRTSAVHCFPDIKLFQNGSGISGIYVRAISGAWMTTWKANIHKLYKDCNSQFLHGRFNHT